MIVGTVRERKIEEYRVGLTPEGSRDLVRRGHRVIVESGAGEGSGFPDEEYVLAGATMVSREAAWEQAELMVKVKEPQPEEFGLMRRDQVLFTYLHLAAEPAVAKALLAAGITSIAYETVETNEESLPLLIPMSQIAGRMAPQVGARWLMKPGPGRGKLMSGLPGSEPAKVVIIGAGVVGQNACEIALGMGAQVTMLAPRLDQLREVDDRWLHRVTTITATHANIEKALTGADLIISAVNVRGGKAAPKLVTREELRLAGPGAVIVDVAIDQGGIFETSRPTSHADPVYVEESVVHYCVANMPGAVPRTSTSALTAATLSYVLAIAEQGATKAIAADPALARGLMTRGGKMVAKGVAQTLGL